MTGGGYERIIVGMDDSARLGYPLDGPAWRLSSGAGLLSALPYTLLDAGHKARLGQFFTPPAVARLMVSMFRQPTTQIRLLDPGAGVGSLTAAFVEEMCGRDDKPLSIDVTAYEVDSSLISYLNHTLAECEHLCAAHRVKFAYTILDADFIRDGVEMIRGGLFAPPRLEFNCVIMNPPYKKIRNDSDHRVLLRDIGMETGNLYSGFLAVAIELLEPSGELVAITPRSFCNGPYFKPFRQTFLNAMALQRIHVMESRNVAFRDDDVLQENIIFHAVKSGERRRVIISSSRGPEAEDMVIHTARYDEVVKPGDPDHFIHITTGRMDQLVVDRIAVFHHSLEDLGIEVSTGRVVDFRAVSFLLDEPTEASAPLIHPTHFHDGFVQWPRRDTRKANALIIAPETKSLFLPAGYYTLVRRFSSKEEPRRVVAAIYDPKQVPAQSVAFENHVNVYHAQGEGLPEALAKGLAVFLNSSLVDGFFRQFSGHTQVNATDLRTLRYPDAETLELLGGHVAARFPSQEEIDALIEERIQLMTGVQSPDPVAAKRKIEEALAILKSLGFPNSQLNERSALALLGLLGLRPEMPWAASGAPLIGITPIMDFVRDHYGKNYAPNSRETIRKESMHQFVEAGLAIPNPDDPDRAVNSPKFCYQIESAALGLLRTYGSNAWNAKLAEYLSTIETLRERYARERRMRMIPISVAEGVEAYLTAGEHNTLVKAIIEEFAPRFAPSGLLIYVGDTGNKFAHWAKQALQDLGVTVDEHGKMPDVVIYDAERNWLLLVEAVTSRGPVDSKRRDELKRLFDGARPGIVYITAFLTRRDMSKYIGEISWSTDVWVSEAPTHLIHFDGEQFLGPYS